MNSLNRSFRPFYQKDWFKTFLAIVCGVGFVLALFQIVPWVWSLNEDCVKDTVHSMIGPKASVSEFDRSWLNGPCGDGVSRYTFKIHNPPDPVRVGSACCSWGECLVSIKENR